MRWSTLSVVAAAVGAVASAWILVWADATIREWPKIAPVAKHYSFGDNDDKIIRLPILDVKGQQAYTLECATAEHEDPGFDYSGDFECRLLPAQSDGYSTLLTENPHQSRDWESRGRFLVEELRGACASYPDYGRVRTFRVRGMGLTLTLSKIRETEKSAARDAARPLRSRLLSFDFDADVQADPGADRAIAAPSRYRRPESHLEDGAVSYDCDRVVVDDDRGPGSAASEVRIVPKRQTVELPGKPVRFRFADERLPEESIAVAVPILAETGERAYEVQCSVYTAEKLPIVIGRWGISCGLFGVDGSRSLLRKTIDPATGRNQGTFAVEQLVPPCASDPYWGSSREFRQRGFRLKLSFAYPELAAEAGVADFFGGGLRRVVLTVEAVVDATADSDLAQPPPEGCPETCR